MKREKVISYRSTIVALAAAVLLFMRWTPEPLLRKPEPPVFLEDLKRGRGADFVGKPAGEDIPRLSGAGDFAAMTGGVDCATAEPAGVIPTGVYSLQPWSSRYSVRKVNGRVSKGGRKAKVVRSPLGAREGYSQYYLLELPDGTYILAQIPQSVVPAIEKGERVTLPVGQKTGMTNTARSYLSGICREYGASMDGVLYAIDNQWYEEHSFTLFIMRFGAALVLFLVLGVGMVLVGNKVFRVDSEGGRK